MSLHNSTLSTEGAAYPWILEHLLAYPGTYEIPLRTMYTLNSTPQAQQYPRQSLQGAPPSLTSTASSPESSPASPNFPLEQQHQLPVRNAGNAADHFKGCLMSYISQLPTQPFSLPPSFITSFVRRCFTADLCKVDFTQALTALDYLKDLENRRKRELMSALQRLGLEQGLVNQAKGDMSKNPRVSEWVQGMQDKERKVEALYTQVYLGLRRWVCDRFLHEGNSMILIRFVQTLINEMRLEPFSKANSIAMLNTLYPPSTATPPTRQLTSEILKSQRDAFFRYIQGVEKNGKDLLKNLEHQNRRPGDENGWAFLRETLDKYLRTANGVIEECQEVSGPECLDSESEAYRRDTRRADSGVSFATGDRPSTSSSNGSRPYPLTTNKPLPASPELQAPQRSAPTRPPPTPKKRGTTLEKIARELRNLRTRNDIKESSTTPNNETKEPKVRSLKKMKSTSSIGGSKAKHAKFGTDEATINFNIDDSQRQRMIQQAQREKENRAPSSLESRHNVRPINLDI